MAEENNSNQTQDPDVQEEKAMATRRLIINLMLSALISLFVFILGFYFFVVPSILRLEIKVIGLDKKGYSLGKKVNDLNVKGQNLGIKVNALKEQVELLR